MYIHERILWGKFFYFNDVKHKVSVGHASGHWNIVIVHASCTYLPIGKLCLTTRWKIKNETSYFNITIWMTENLLRLITIICWPNNWPESLELFANALLFFGRLVVREFWTFIQLLDGLGSQSWCHQHLNFFLL